MSEQQKQPHSRWRLSVLAKRITIHGVQGGDVKVSLLGVTGATSVSAARCSCDSYLHLECDRPADGEPITVHVQHVQSRTAGTAVVRRQWSKAVFCEFEEYKLRGGSGGGDGGEGSDEVGALWLAVMQGGREALYCQAMVQPTSPSRTPWFLTAEGLYGATKGTYTRVSSWPLISLYARAGEAMLDAVVFAGSVAVGGRTLMGVDIPAGHTRATLCRAFDDAAAVALHDVDTALQAPLEEVMDKVQDVAEVAVTWCRCAVCESPLVALGTSLVGGAFTLPLRALHAATSGAGKVGSAAVAAVTQLLPGQADKDAATTATASAVASEDSASFTTAASVEPVLAAATATAAAPVEGEGAGEVFAPCEGSQPARAAPAMAACSARKGLKEHGGLMIEPEGLSPTELVGLLEKLSAESKAG